ncbi:MAG: uracil-DNA glycosylase [Bacteroidales bacterium]|nr:uracil-DNA glycosylase [Bacteroidales bacterium]
MNEQIVKIDQSWYKELKDEFKKDYFDNLRRFILQEKSQYMVFPRGSQIFSAFNLTPIDKVKLVIIGQDPYHGQGQAHGLCFSVQPGVKIPPSLLNIYKELKTDLDFKIPNHGNLEYWAEQGVFLINATLTVRANSAGSHQNKGWEIFTDTVIRKLNDKCNNLVFLLWGRYAQAKEKIIDPSKHLVLKAAHPSPLSAYNGFFGCKHFSKSNDYLQNHGKKPIDWQIPIYDATTLF